LLTAAPTNWNYKFAQTAKNIHYTVYILLGKNVNIDVC